MVIGLALLLALSSAGPLGSPGELGLDPLPLLHHPDAAAAAAALEAGEAARALALARRALAHGPLEVEERAAVRWVEAVALERRGRVQEAFEAYGRLHRGHAPPGLSAHAAFHHARLGIALAGRGRIEGGLPDSVTAALEAVPLESRFGPEAHLHLARRHLAAGEIDAACALAEAAAEQTEGLRAEAGARLAIARCKEARARARAAEGEGRATVRRALAVGAEAGARLAIARCKEARARARAAEGEGRATVRRALSEAAAEYRIVAALWPEQAAGGRAAEHAARLASAGIRPAPVNADAELDRARRIHARRFWPVAAPALNRTRRILPAGHRARHEIDLMRAALAENRRHFRSASRLYHQVRRHGATPELKARGALGAEGLRARWAPSRSVDRYLAVAETWPRTEAAAEARLRAGRAAWRLGRTGPALEAFEACLASHPDAPAAAGCAFGLGWAAWLEGDLSTARERIAPLVDDDLRARYWYGRLLEASGDHEAAFILWRGVLTEAPYGYYAVMAWARMHAVDPEGTPMAPPRTEAIAPAAHVDVLAAESLVRMGLKRDARAHLVSLERARLGPADRIAAARSWHSLGETARAMRMAIPDWDGGLEHPPKGPAVLAALLAYPRAFSHAVESPDRDPTVPATLLYALIRAESAFDPEARSHAGALGLTQVIPPTARTTAARLGVDPFRFRMLTEPETSVRIGSAYLGWLLQHFDGHPAMAIAAYNAGEDAVERWLSRRGHLPVDAFIEEIPFEETNRYTRRVLSFWAIYRTLYEAAEGPPLPLDFELPAVRPALVARAE